ncbi:MAG: SIR2 family protein [Terriglobales bacterium]
MTTHEELISKLAEGRVMLFAGSGLSTPLKLPTWDQLMGHFASELGFASEIFQQSANNMVLAEYYSLVKGPIGPLRGWMDREWHADPARIKQSKAHKLITKLGFPIIYTTNYDRWIEMAFESEGVAFAKVRNVGDLQRAKPGEVQIIKFHGDFDDDESIVLTESQYFRRLNFEDPLDIKLRGDTLERGVLFLGYSLSDINIRYLLFKLQEIWSAYGGTQRRPRSYIFLARPNTVQEKVLEARGVTAILSELDDPTEGLVQFLESLYEGLHPNIRPNGLNIEAAR